MSVVIKGSIEVVTIDCTARVMGIEVARLLLGAVVDPMRQQSPPKQDMQDLLLGLLAGAAGHFAGDLCVEEIHEQLDNCKRMVSEVPHFKRAAQMPGVPSPAAM